jgi:uncharacterized repeat protein (TIGR03803 family)
MKKRRLHPFHSWIILTCLAASLPASTALGQFQYERLKSFGFPEQSGRTPSGLIEGSEDVLYGTTRNGGTDDSGTVFKLNRDGSGYRVLHAFSGRNGDGLGPRAAVMEARDGVLYGTTGAGGANEIGTVFKLNKDGSDYTVLHSFTGGAGGSQPQGAVVEGNDGALYGTTLGGLTFQDHGVVFKLHKDGSAFSVLHNFTVSEEWGYPYAGLVEASDGALYGTTSSKVFKINKDGSSYVVLHSFTGGSDGSDPHAALTEGSDGALYGTTSGGGTNDQGTVFKLNKDGTAYAVLHRFSGPLVDGSGPQVALAEGTDGALYGTTSSTAFKLDKDGGGYITLRRFSADDGNTESVGTLIQGRDRALYGMTEYRQVGTVFKLNTDGSGYGLLHRVSISGGDGSEPMASLLEASDGALYGTTFNGGYYDRYGTVFRINKDGSGYSILRSFDGTAGDGSSPTGGLVEGSDGALYGTTRGGGEIDRGTVFKLNKDGNGFTILHSFPSNATDGYAPTAALVEGSDGALYGTTYYGTNYSIGENNEGAVFKLNKNGSAYVVLRRFDGEGHPDAALIEGSDGALYGTTLSTIFKLNKDGSNFNVLHTFNFDPDGGESHAALIEGSDGALYGTTEKGGIMGQGTLFKLNKDGSGYLILHRFNITTDGGIWPVRALVEGDHGALYGANSSTEFKLNKDGTGYTVVHTFDGGGNLSAAALLKGSDGALYATANLRGDLRLGLIFALRPQRLRLTLAAIDSGAQLGFKLVGEAGVSYTIQASTNLVNWTVLTNFVSANGTNEFTESTTQNFSRRFYRAASP